MEASARPNQPTSLLKSSGVHMSNGHAGWKHPILNAGQQVKLKTYLLTLESNAPKIASQDNVVSFGLYLLSFVGKRPNK